MYKYHSTYSTPIIHVKGIWHQMVMYLLESESKKNKYVEVGQ